MKNIVVLVSGNGTNLQALINAEKSGEIKNGKITCVISSKEDAYALERAKINSIPSVVVKRTDYPDTGSYSKALLSELRRHSPDLIVLAGFMTIFDESVVREYPYKIINVHSSLIPSFCGKGYYGLRIHKAALDYGVKVSGATVHFVSEDVDAGAVILQESVPVKPNDTPEILQRRVMDVEWELLPQAVSLFCEDRIRIRDGKAVIIPSREYNIAGRDKVPFYGSRQLMYRGELTWKLFQRKMHVMTGRGVTPQYAKKCARALNSFSDDMIDSLCRSLKKCCLRTARSWGLEKVNEFMRVPVSEATPPRDILEDITPKRFLIIEQLNSLSYYIGCSCDWDNHLPERMEKYGLGIAVYGDKIIFVGTDMPVTINDVNAKPYVNFAEDF